MKPVNRVLLAFKGWEDKKNELQPLLKSGTTDERAMLALQLEHLRQAGHRLRHAARPDEKPFLTLLENQLNKLEKQLYPNFLQRILLRLKDRIFDGPAYLEQQGRQRAANMETLKQQLRERGLSSVAGKLEQHLDQDHRQVCLPLDCQLTADKRLNLDLHFDKDVYGDFQLGKLEGTLVENGEAERYHSFELPDWPGLKADQVLSLLEGRALKQHYTDATGHENTRWVELGNQGVQHYSPEHGFDIATTLAALPNITRNKEELTQYLENGQCVPTHWKQNGQFQNIFVQADPANGSLKIFDAKMKPVSAEQLSQKAQQQEKNLKPSVVMKPTRQSQKNGHKVH